MNHLTDYLYDFGVLLTYEMKEQGGLFGVDEWVKNYCAEQDITDKEWIGAIKDYADYFIDINQTWFPDREDLEDWIREYRKKKHLTV